MRYTALIAIISLFFLGCKKNKFSTRPQLTYKSVSAKRVIKNQVVNFKFTFTDAEGDINLLYWQKVGLNCIDTAFKDKLPIPVDLPQIKNQKGDLTVSFVNGDNSINQLPTIVTTCPIASDTCFFRFVLTDQAKNKSDTVNSDIIVLFN